MSQPAAEREFQYIGKSHGAEDPDRDLIHQPSKRLDAVWRVDQYIANADGKPEIQDFWRKLKLEEMKVVGRLKDLIKAEIKPGCF